MIFSLGHKERFNRVFSKLIFTQEKILRRYSTGDANGDEADFDSSTVENLPPEQEAQMLQGTKHLTSVIQKYAPEMLGFFGQYQDKKFLGREVRTYKSLKTFFKAVYAGRKTNQGFKIAFTPKNAPDGKRAKRELFFKYCQMIWLLDDGNHRKKLHCIMEEINRVTITTGDEDSIYGELLEVGRKFGFVIHSVSP